MYFEDGSVVQRLPLEVTAVGQGANCEAVNSRLLDCVNGRIEPRLCTRSHTHTHTHTHVFPTYKQTLYHSVVLSETGSRYRVCTKITLTRPDPDIITDPVTRDPVLALR